MPTRDHPTSLVKELVEEDVQLPPFYKPCGLCGRPTVLSAQFMLLDKVWEEANKQETCGYLHLGCVEKRLGRALTIDDFEALPINLAFFYGWEMGVNQAAQERKE